MAHNAIAMDTDEAMVMQRTRETVTTVHPLQVLGAERSSQDPMNNPLALQPVSYGPMVAHRQQNALHETPTKVALRAELAHTVQQAHAYVAQADQAVQEAHARNQVQMQDVIANARTVLEGQSHQTKDRYFQAVAAVNKQSEEVVARERMALEQQTPVQQYRHANRQRKIACNPIFVSVHKVLVQWWPPSQPGHSRT